MGEECRQTSSRSSSQAAAVGNLHSEGHPDNLMWSASKFSLHIVEHNTT